MGFVKNIIVFIVSLIVLLAAIGGIIALRIKDKWKPPLISRDALYIIILIIGIFALLIGAFAAIRIALKIVLL